MAPNARELYSASSQLGWRFYRFRVFAPNLGIGCGSFGVSRDRRAPEIEADSAILRSCKLICSEFLPVLWETTSVRFVINKPQLVAPSKGKGISRDLGGMLDGCHFLAHVPTLALRFTSGRWLGKSVDAPFHFVYIRELLVFTEELVKYLSKCKGLKELHLELEPAKDFCCLTKTCATSVSLMNSLKGIKTDASITIVNNGRA